MATVTEGDITYAQGEVECDPIADFKSDQHNVISFKRFWFSWGSHCDPIVLVAKKVPKR